MNVPRRLLLINPNTTEAVTHFMADHLRAASPAAAQWTAVTAAFGAPYIACEASPAVAGHAVLDAWQAALGERDPANAFDAVLIGCFGDPGLFALRECSAVPVTGLAEAAFIEAARQGPFAVVTGGQRWKPMLQRLAQSLGFGPQLVHIETVVPTGAALRADPVLAEQVLGSAVEVAQRSGARSVIVGGAGLAGLAARLQPRAEVPLIDSVEAGARVLLERTFRAEPGSALNHDTQERLALVRSCTTPVRRQST
jgi:Asp/Glu/hydantoin racemase